MLNRLDYDLDNLLRHHAEQGGGNCVLLLLDLDDFHAKVAAVKSHPDDLPMMDDILAHIAATLPDKPTLYRHGRDSVLGVYWSQTLSQVLPEVFRWHADFPTKEFTTAGKTFRFTLTATVGEFPTHSNRLTRLLRILEDCMFQAKESGDKGRVVVAYSGPMVLKSSYYSPPQLRRLAALAQRMGVTEARLLREALDLILRKYDG